MKVKNVYFAKKTNNNLIYRCFEICLLSNLKFINKDLKILNFYKDRYFKTWFAIKKHLII
jgi:hypothetical protein